MEIFENSSKLYLSILSRLNVDHEDEVYCELILGIIERQTKDYILMCIWKNMDASQCKHFREYLNQMSVITSWASNDDLLLEFAMIYPDLMDKVYFGLSNFFRYFILRFNEMSQD